MSHQSSNAMSHQSSNAMSHQSSNAFRGNSGKKRQKYVPVISQHGLQEVVFLPGRHQCTCEASKHPLINNCLNCGRIVCQQEGSGPCFTCKQVVCTKIEQEVLNRNSKTSAKLLQKLLADDATINQPNDASVDKSMSRLAAAVEHKNKLLEYDQTASRRTKVIDDQNDFFELESNKWLTKEQKKKIATKKEEVYEAHFGSRRNQKLSFDFAGRQILEEKPDFNFSVEELLNSEDLLKPDTSMFDCKNIPPYEDLYGFTFDPKYEGEEPPIRPRRRLENLGDVKLNLMRIQDRQLQEMSDEGVCLSLHQPYASLLVSGIKTHEGRIWYTCYRGRLWIQSASKVPTKEEIIEAENAYRFNEGHTTFPESYPTGCLLGCVDLVDCLPQEEYREKFPDGESASPYVFICENPQELMIKFPMKGKHKIFKMDGKFHQAAKKTLKK